MPESVEPLRWSVRPMADDTQPGTAPLHYTAPGGWLVVSDPSTDAPDRPWCLYRHGSLVSRCHTLRIAKGMASGVIALPASDTAEDWRTPEGHDDSPDQGVHQFDGGGFW